MQSDAVDLPLTRCASCGTVFEVPRELLEGPDTRVRCGECASVFDALAGLETDTEHGAALTPSAPLVVPPRPPERVDAASLADDTAALDITYSDVDLFSEHAELPELHYLGDETIDTSAFDFGDAELDRSFEDALFTTHERAPAGEEPGYLLDGADEERVVDASVPPATADVSAAGEDGVVAATLGARVDAEAGAGADEPARDAEPDALATDIAADSDASPASGAVETSSVVDEETPSPRSRGPLLLRATLLVALVLLVIALFAVRERERLHDNAFLRPLLVGACRMLGCTVPARVELDALALLQKNVYAHPGTDGLLVVDVAFRNRASFAQRYPVLFLRLRDRVGRVVATHEFRPADYLDGWTAGDTLGAGRRLDLDLEIPDPGSDADSYEFEFRESPR